ncbi:hypothetical protein SAMD00019534_017160 [Acytostelium subglobosum LB1]|uniref:hypothetical protein n=1 Tax=Acytostelium subglobosum LB1 TaxID=1410327 RepID=UPI0006449D55|nr:hypothetical protein SAMD00019534_017160 [Acytostelium subglobosum LB1]GAM18541.1 hypothetical protein SAMD00019534_017160 [Acytostelium subglobosum LB1]|eukprot:XP_012757761.1 hypothetical protein SAMD00019534_017160 [Acytostelium subglobosum LB1]
MTTSPSSPPKTMTRTKSASSTSAHGLLSQSLNNRAEQTGGQQQQQHADGVGAKKGIINGASTVKTASPSSSEQNKVHLSQQFQHTQDYCKTLLSEIQFLERLLQDQISQRNSNTRTNKAATGGSADKEMSLREGDIESEEVELLRYEDQLKQMIASKKQDLRAVIAQTDKHQPTQKRSAFLKSGTVISIFPSVIEERLCSSLPLVRLEKPKIRKTKTLDKDASSNDTTVVISINGEDNNNNNNNNDDDNTDTASNDGGTNNKEDGSSPPPAVTEHSTINDEVVVGEDTQSTAAATESKTSTTTTTTTAATEGKDDNRVELLESTSSLSNSQIISNNLLPKPITTLIGPNAELPEDEQLFNSSVCCKSNSSYPKHAVSGRRQGDPICDRFKVSIYRDNIIATLADGCNWGRLPFEAATNATNAFLAFMEENYHEINTIRKAGSFLLGAMTAAHKGVIAGKSEVWESGTTTLIGGLLSKIRRSKNDNLKNMSKSLRESTEAEWVFTGVTLGDCKSFHYSKKLKVFSDITKGNRQNLSDARDPGGRLGPYVGNGEPDLRNLSVFYKLCDQDDLILLLSDGVHDNLDPQQLGVTPRELGIDADTWDLSGQKYPDETDRVKNNFRTNWLHEHFNQDDQLTPQYITNQLLKHCTETTQTSRDFMENTSKKLPQDYKLYPGKMDHNTCICFRVGNNSLN